MTGNRLRDLRDSYGYSVRETAKLAGVSHQTVHRLEHQPPTSHTDPDVLERIAGVFDRTPAEVWPETAPPAKIPLGAWA